MKIQTFTRVKTSWNECQGILESPATRLLTKQLANGYKQDIKVTHYWPLRDKTVGHLCITPHNWPAMLRAWENAITSCSFSSRRIDSDVTMADSAEWHRQGTWPRQRNTHKKNFLPPEEPNNVGVIPDHNTALQCTNSELNSGMQST